MRLLGTQGDRHYMLDITRFMYSDLWLGKYQAIIPSLLNVVFPSRAKLDVWVHDNKMTITKNFCYEQPGTGQCLKSLAHRWRTSNTAESEAMLQSRMPVYSTLRVRGQ